MLKKSAIKKKFAWFSHAYALFLFKKKYISLSHLNMFKKFTHLHMLPVCIKSFHEKATCRLGSIKMTTFFYKNSRPRPSVKLITSHWRRDTIRGYLTRLQSTLNTHKAKVEANRVNCEYQTGKKKLQRRTKSNKMSNTLGGRSMSSRL
jgi:hypothetical protein